MFHVWGDPSTPPPPKKKKIIQDVLLICEGVINIADGLGFHGKGIEQHDERHFVVLNLLKEVGLTLYGDKLLWIQVTNVDILCPSSDREWGRNQWGEGRSNQEYTYTKNARDTIIPGSGLICILVYSDLSTVAEPIQRLTHKNVDFKWQSEKQASFELKELITRVQVH